MIVRESDEFGLSLDPGLGCTQVGYNSCYNVDVVRRGKLLEVV